MSASNLVNRKASDKQISMLVAVAHRKGLDRLAFLEWLEYDSGLEIQVSKLDDIHMMDVSSIKDALELMS